MDRPVDPAAAEQRLVGGVDDGIGRLDGDVAVCDIDTRAHLPDNICRALADRSDEGGDRISRAGRRRVDVRAEVGRSSGARPPGGRRGRRRQLDGKAESFRSGRGWPGDRRAATDHDVVVDGEVVAYDSEGRHTFQSVGRADRDHAFVVFDLLALDGDDLRDRPWSERRALLECGCDPVSPVTITPVSDDAEVMEAATRAQRFEGIVAKRTSSTYQSGRRAPAWVKVKYTNAQEMVVGGYKLGEGNRTGLFGSLLVGVHDEAGALQFVSAVGTGFNERTLTT